MIDTIKALKRDIIDGNLYGEISDKAKQLLLASVNAIEEQIGQKEDFANVVRSLQEKKKLIENQKELDIANRDSNGVRRNGDYDYFCGCIERDIMAIEALEEIIIQNFA